MKKPLASILLLLLFFLVLTTVASAIPMDASGTPIQNSPGFHWVDKPYWTPTDKTTGPDGSTLFTLAVENAAYESDFGLFTVDNIHNPTTITSQFQVYDYLAEPSFIGKSVYFKDLGGGSWGVTLGNPYNPSTVWTPFGIEFGFYYAVHEGTGTTVAYTYYSDWSFNTVDKGDQHVAIEWDGVENVIIHLEDLRTAQADWDWSDMTIVGHDVKPVTEPATMLLFGSGLLGLAAVGRRRIL